MRKKIVFAVACFTAVLFIAVASVQAVDAQVKIDQQVLEARAFSIKKFFKQTAKSFKGLFGGGESKSAPSPAPMPQPILQPTLPVVGSSSEAAPTATQIPALVPVPDVRGANPQPVRSAPRVPAERSGGATTVFDGGKSVPGGTDSEGPITGGGIGASAVSKSTSVEPIKLVLETKSALQGLKEGDKIQFSSILTMSDGTKKDVTAQSDWKVLGFMGSMISPGVFQAKLDASVSELGESNGSVVATWKDQASGKVLLGNTPVFKVEMKIDDLGPQDGSLYKSGLKERIIRFFDFLKRRK